MAVVVMEIVIFTLVFSFVEHVMTVSEQTECPKYHFKLEEMESCRLWIGCEDLNNIKIINRLGTGAVKDVFLANWNGFPIVLSVPVNPNFLDDFLNGVEILKLLSPSTYIVQFLGYCDISYSLLTEYHPAGNAADFFSRRLLDNPLQSLSFCRQYALILNYLHNGPAGRRVFCDSNSLDKLLSQLLVTSDESLILNDVDALPEVVNGSGVKCGHRKLEGTFIAPEQLWNRIDEFSDDLMQSYDEKTDIWKAAAVCEYFLQRAHDGVVVRYRLFEFHSRCRSHDPLSRPSAEDLIEEYSKAIETFSSHSEL